MQPQTPYLEALRAYAERNPGRFHVPGHKGGAGADPALIEAFGERALALDIPALTEGIDAGPGADAVPARAGAGRRGLGRAPQLVPDQRRLAGQPRRLPGARAARRAGRRPAQRPLEHDRRPVLSGLRPAFVAPELDPSSASRTASRPRRSTARSTATPGAVGAIVVSPTYFGAVADVRGLARVAHEHGVPLVVDEAWGAHLAFHDALPEHALAAGADLVVSSTHKIVGSLTQSAMLHLGARRARSTSTWSTAP